MIDPVFQAALAAGTFTLSLKLTGDHAPETPWWRRSAGIGYGAFGLWLALLLMSSAVPVIRDMRALVVERGTGYVVLSVTADRRREIKCRFEYDSAYLVYANRPMRQAGIEVIGDHDPGERRPAGIQWFGDWRIRFDPSMPPESIKIVSRHDCGLFGGSVTTTNGPFSIGQQ